MKSLTITGETTNGKFGLYNMNQLNDFCSKNPNKKLIVTVQIEDKKSRKGLLSYFYTKVIPMWVEYYAKIGQIKNSIQVEIELRSICPITQRKSLSELSYDEMLLFMDQVKIATLENINQFIEEPRCI